MIGKQQAARTGRAKTKGRPSNERPMAGCAPAAGRRRFLSDGVALAGAAFTAGAASALAGRDAAAQALPVPEWTRSMGREIPDLSYGTPIRFEDHVKRARSDVLVNRQRWSDWSMTPLQYQPAS